jgi:hypothetical protein
MMTEPPDHSAHDDDFPQEIVERPWIHLANTHDVEAWIDNYNWELQRLFKQAGAIGVGICFSLAHGGEIFMHTTSEGEILLDVTPEAEWVTPVLTAATGVEPPGAQIWTLPGDVLTQLVLGLSGLIASSRAVIGHQFNTKKKQRINW